MIEYYLLGSIAAFTLCITQWEAAKDCFDRPKAIIALLTVCSWSAVLLALITTVYDIYMEED